MADIIIPRPPYFKGKGAVFNPVVKYGIPKEADSRLNPKVIGTPQWESYWNEQLWYCMNGYTSGGITIPGRYYYYLNFNAMSTISGTIVPDMVDLHLELAYLVDYAILNKKNIICAKKRRAGISEFTQKAVVDYGWRFTNGSFKVGIAAGLEDYVLDFMQKWKDADSLLPPELRTKRLKNNKGEVIAGYSYDSGSGEMIEGGTKNVIYTRTMFKNPALFKGLFLSIVIAEECGEFEKLEQFYAHTKACIMDGSKQVGIMMFYGTGGNMNKGGKAFETMWDEAEKNNFIKFLIPATRFHKPYYGGCKMFGEDVSETPNLLLTKKPYEIIGVEDIKAAEESVLLERNKILSEKPLNIQKYQEHLRDYPLTKEDIFSLSVDNDFDSEVLNDQRNAISSVPAKYVKCQLDYEKDAKGEIIHPFKMVLRVDNDVAEDGICFLIHQDHLTPVKGYSNLYCAGGDSFDQDKARTSKSMGAMCVLIRRNDIPGAMQMAPVATICCRPPRKEIFYEMCLKLSIFFGLRESLLIDVANKLIFEYFIERGFQHVLAYRPKKFESEKSEQTHIYGVHLNNYSKPLMVGLMQSAIVDHGKDIWFPDLIKQLANYNQVTIGSDNDLADAYGIALMQNSNEVVPAQNDNQYEQSMFETPEWFTDAQGVKRMVTGNKDPLIAPDQDHPSRWR